MNRSHSEPEASQDAQGGLFEDDPKPNSPEDLGRVPPERVREIIGDEKPRERNGPVYGQKRADPKPQNNLAPSSLSWDDARKFVDWIQDQPIPSHVNVTVGHILTTMSGCTTEDLRWLCRAILQAKRAPDPVTMKKAVLARDVGVLRPGGDLETSVKESK